MDPKRTIETGMLLDREGPDGDRVYLQYTVATPWWMFWRSGRSLLIMTPGQARTLARGLDQAVKTLETKRNGEKRIITLDR